MGRCGTGHARIRQGTPEVTDAFYDIGDLIVTPGNTYRVERILGFGGMGTVCLARDKMLGSLCVIKILHPELTSGSIRLRFEHEARVIAQIVHPHIVRVIRLGTLEDDAKTPFYVMEHLVGESLRAALTKRKNDRGGGGFRIDQALNIASQIFYGLEAVHERGIVHRDMKPENVILHVDARSNRVAKIIDFGVMRLLAETGRETFAGTFGYAAPEQIRGEEIGPKVDLFATGLMLFEMLTGRRPYETYGSGEAGAVARLDVVAPSLDKYGEFPPALVKLLARVLALKPEDRPTDAFEVASALEKMSSALAPLDIHDVVTDQAHDQGAVDAAASTAVRTITLADLAAPTDPDADLPVWMRQLRMRAKQAEVLGYEPTEAQRAAMDGNDTQPGAPPFVLNDTKPLAPRGATLRLPGRPPTPSVAEMVTTPPSGKVRVPDRAGHVMYVDSIPPASLSPPVPSVNSAKSPSPAPARVSDRREPEASDRRSTPARASAVRPSNSSARRRAASAMPLWKRQLLVFGLFLLCVTTVGLVIVAVRRPEWIVRRSPATTGKLPAARGGP
jgi:serine/threonine protein kinase